MVNSTDILKEIAFLSEYDRLNIDLHNKNPYRLVLKGKDETTLLYFSCPVYSEATKKLINCRWTYNETGVTFKGVNAIVTATENQITLEQQGKRCEVVVNENVEPSPTYNGVLLKTDCTEIKVKLKFDFNGNVHASAGFFAYIQQDPPPVFVFNALFAEKAGIPLPLNFEYEQTDETQFDIRLKSDCKSDKLYFDINAYTPKLIFDTTVSSKHMQQNNVYGEIAFLGNTERRGKEWLYARVDTAKLDDIKASQVIEAHYYLPEYLSSGEKLKLNVLSAPWCSFGTTWENKNHTETNVRFSYDLKKYKKLEVTDVIKSILITGESREKSVLIRSNSDKGCTAVATGDNYVNPQILKIKIKGELFDGNNQI